VNARPSTEARKRSLLRAVERALFDAISDSPELHRSLWLLQRAGYTLRLSIDCEREEGAGAGSSRRPRAATDRPFRIDGDDLRFLRSIGIDPTRPSRSRKPR